MSNLTDEQKSQALDTLLKSCPFIGIWGPTGVGKTTFISQLMEHPRYRKMLFIDVDKGSATISHLTGQPELCDHRLPPFSADSALKKLRWACKEINNAHKVPDIGSVVIEGVAGLYNGIASALISQLDVEELPTRAPMRCYNVASNLIKNLTDNIYNMRDRLANAGQIGPVVVTSTCKQRQDQTNGEEWYVPGMSANATGYLQEKTDVFIELRRESKNSPTRILTDRDDRVDTRKFRHAGASKAVANLRNAGLADMLQTWANARAMDTDAIKNHLQQEQS